jgi:sugar lactone lactonase YvrE
MRSLERRWHALSFRTALVAAALFALAGPDAAIAQDQQQQPLRAGSVETLTGEIEGGSGGISVDAAGNVYVADFGTHLGGGTPGTKVFRVSPDGEVEVFATGLRGASGNEFDSKGNLFQSNVAAGAISRIAPDGSVTEFATGQAGPVGIVRDPEDNLYVTNCGNYVAE